VKYQYMGRICWGVYPPKPNPYILSDCHNVPVYTYGEFASPPYDRFVCSTCRKDCTVYAAEDEEQELSMMPPNEELTPMEREVLKLFMLGHPDKRIAEERVITRDTVLFHLRNIATKWGVTTRDGIRTYADQHQLVP
jgi:DNA-binding CsgD family transcriptional regulator